MAKTLFGKSMTGRKIAERLPHIWLILVRERGTSKWQACDFSPLSRRKEAREIARDYRDEFGASFEYRVVRYRAALSGLGVSE